MSKIVEIKNLSKKYIIQGNSSDSYSTLVDTFQRKSKKIMRKVFRKSSLKEKEESSQEAFWALNDVSFSIDEGDRIGIIGRNGAGKSTLLKILSKITEPSSGYVNIKGKVACLMEVGTGFHPELTGRENIYLNGAILGMKRTEIKRKFDEIVEFADIAKFLDTPMKRFSSGMHARLGFAIAAHLNSDLLIVDEVLAVGDAQFQEKCLKKMNDLGSTGRTILFVSHDISSVLNLCNKGVYLEKGRIKEQGLINNCVNSYMHDCKQRSMCWQGNHGDEHIRFYEAKINSYENREFFYQNENPIISLSYEILKYSPDLVFGIAIMNQRNQVIGYSHSGNVENYNDFIKPGKHTITFQLNGSVFHDGEYYIKIDCSLFQRKNITKDEIILKYQIYPFQSNIYFNHANFKQGVSLGNRWVLN